MYFLQKTTRRLAILVKNLEILIATTFANNLSKIFL